MIQLGGLILALLAFMSLGTTVAQDEEPPFRRSDRRAPERAPAVLRSERGPGGHVQTVIVLAPEADAFIASEAPNENFGASSLFIGYNLTGDANFGAERTLLRFDVANTVPDGAVVNAATLRLHLNWSDPADDEPMGTILRRTAAPWDEFTVTWNTEPAWGSIFASAQVSSTLTWYEWDVTELVANWAAGDYPDYGMELIGDERVQQRERGFYASETATDLYPRLIIDYTALGDLLPPEVSVDALPTYSLRTFAVSWSGTDPGGSGIDTYDVQYRANGGDWIDWITDTTATEAQFVGAGGYFYEFRARGEDNAGNVEPFGDPEASTTVDAHPPVSTIHPLPDVVHTTQFSVTWSGTDAVSGIAYYDVRYRFNGGAWNVWLPQTLATSATFNAAQDGVYEFEVRAVDNLGQVESFTGSEASVAVDAVAPFIVPRLWLPLILQNANL
jgi:hypothetical protein